MKPNQSRRAAEASSRQMRVRDADPATIAKYTAPRAPATGVRPPPFATDAAPVADRMASMSIGAAPHRPGAAQAAMSGGRPPTPALFAKSGAGPSAKKRPKINVADVFPDDLPEEGPAVTRGGPPPPPAFQPPFVGGVKGAMRLTAADAHPGAFHFSEDATKLPLSRGSLGAPAPPAGGAMGMAPSAGAMGMPMHPTSMAGPYGAPQHAKPTPVLSSYAKPTPTTFGLSAGKSATPSFADAFSASSSMGGAGSRSGGLRPPVFTPLLG